MIKGSSGHQEKNGHVEVMHRMFRGHAKKMYEKQGWLDAVEEMAATLNSTPMRIGGKSPVELLTGVPFRRSNLGQKEWINGLNERREAVRQLRRFKQQATEEDRRKVKKGKFVKPVVGDYVHVRTSRNAKRGVIPDYSEPMRVVEIEKDGLHFLAENEKGTLVRSIVEGCIISGRSRDMEKIS